MEISENRFQKFLYKKIGLLEKRNIDLEQLSFSFKKIVNDGKEDIWVGNFLKVKSGLLCIICAGVIDYYIYFKMFKSKSIHSIEMWLDSDYDNIDIASLDEEDYDFVEKINSVINDFI